MKTSNHKKHLGSQRLKEKFLQCFGVRDGNSTALRDVVRELIECGTPRQILMVWASEAGFSKSARRSILSRIFVSLGIRERQRGAGRRSSPAALELLAHACHHNGENSLNILCAAWRAGKSQIAAAPIPNHANAGACGLIEAPQLGAFCHRAGRIIGKRCLPTTAFKRTFKPATGVRCKNHGTL